MARFDAPDPGNENTKNTQWSEAAPPGMRSPDYLWGEYWQRFNMFRLPISDKEEYFKIAMAVAKYSKSKEDFERKFEEKNKRRSQGFHSMLDKMYWAIEETHPARDAQNPPCAAHTSAHVAHTATSFAQNLSCLEHFVQLLNDYISKRKADKESEKIIVEKQDHTKNNSCQERGHILIEDEAGKLIREISPIPSADPEYEEYEEYLDGQLPDENEWSSQLPHDIDWGYKLDAEYKARRMRHKESDTFARADFDSLMLLPDDAASHTLNSDDDTPSIQQVPSLISNDSQDLEERIESLATQDAQRRRSSIPSKSSSTSSAKKRVRSDDDEEISTHEPKRRKLENTLSNDETSPTPQITRASSVQAAHGSASRKRSRPNEDEEDNGFKRQKIEALPRPPSPVPIASSAEDGSTDYLAQGSSEKVLKEQVPENNNGKHKRRKQKPTPPTSRAKSSRNTLNTRSSRRAKSSTLWELDSSGKPRST